jgi:hypothetical protein
MMAEKETGRKIHITGGNIRPGFPNVRPVIISGLLLLLAILLTNLIITGAFTRYANCDYLIVTRLKMDPFFCNGYEVKVFDATLFSIPGMKNVMDPPLEIARLAAAGIAILLFALISLFLTVIVVNYRTIVRLITFHMDEWKKFMAGARIWLLLFVGMCLVFYYAVVK